MMMIAFEAGAHIAMHCHMGAVGAFEWLSEPPYSPGTSC
jgi:hypothetical protein